MNNDITNWLSAASCIALISDGRVACAHPWLRLAASAYRPSKHVVPWAEVECVLIMDGEVTYARDGNWFRLCRADDLQP